MLKTHFYDDFRKAIKCDSFNDDDVGILKNQTATEVGWCIGVHVKSHTETNRSNGTETYGAHSWLLLKQLIKSH